MAPGTDGSLVATLANVEPAVEVRGGFLPLSFPGARSRPGR